MNTASANNPGPANPFRSLRKVVFRSIAVLASLAILAITGYSIFVACEVPDPQETIILGQSTLASGSPASLRILVRNRINQRPVSGAAVELNLVATNGAIKKLGNFHTDANGGLSEGVIVPQLPAGEYQLIVTTSSGLGSDRVTRKVSIQAPARLLLSSDKPIYQPGQTIHLRSLVLDRYTEKPFAGTPVTFEISDPKGNKVFKASYNASSFGIASTDFTLATELNLGRYAIRVLTGEAVSELTVEVKNYVLPKFKVQVTSDKSYYLPGQQLAGAVRADYFFGKPTSGASVKLTIQTFQEKPVVLTELSGRTDAQGRFPFHFALPNFFTGLPQNNDQAILDLTAEVRDTAGHLETKNLSLSVAKDNLEIAAIPDAGAWIPNVENKVYVLTSYPDGRPAECKIALNGAAGQTDAQGLCVLKLTPADAGQVLQIRAEDGTGNKRDFTYKPDTIRASPAFLLRTDKSIYQAGETAQVALLSTNKNDTIFLDVIKDGQTMLTRTVSLADHKGAYALNLPGTLTGPLKLNAYVITSDGEDRGCSRLIYVRPASGLRIAGKLSKPVYRPGETARMEFAVTDASGHPAPAALGIAAVDESVFALAENRPGLLQQFLDAEGELLKPRYQIKSFESPARLFESGNQTLAAAYLASLEASHPSLTLEDMVNNGYVSQGLVDNARNLMRNPALQKYRSDPQYAAVIRLLEGTQGNYSLREATGAVKAQAVEAHRNAYFKTLQQYLLFGFLVLLFLTPVMLFIYYTLPGTGINPKALSDERVAHYIKFAGTAHKQLALLTLLPLICYPVGFKIFENSHNPGWILLGFEALVVLLDLSVQYIRINATPEPVRSELAPLKGYLVAFLSQFVLSRAGIALMVLYPPREVEGVFMLWLLGSAIAPLMVLGMSGSHIRRRVAEKGSGINPFANTTVVEILAVLSAIAILAGLLLPALARAKAKAVGISLLSDLKQIELANQTATEEGGSSNAGNPNPPRVRHDFPETLLWRPELITDDHGLAVLEFPLADSITTWRASVDGVNSVGKMGNLELPITVFQDFFVDIDLPVSLSLGDQVTVPLTCYNYLKEPQDVRLTVTSADWFESPLQAFTLHVNPGEVKSAGLPLKVLGVGLHTLKVVAQGTKMADAIEREIRVVPTGERTEYTRNDVLKNGFADTFMVPAEAIPGSQSLWVRFYPSHFSQVVEGLDSILQAPYGCFEQTSSCTYPNVLVLDYMKRTGRITPEIEIKARKFITTGYQRLLTFEVLGGGFEWFGRPPANVCLTAYGILEFTDMARVQPVDEAVTERARRWLYGQQKGDGSWSEIDRGWTWAGRGSMTAFVAWALAESGDRSANMGKALNYLRTHPNELDDNYTKALAANAFLAHDRNDPLGIQLAEQLKRAALTDEKGCLHWTSSGYSVTYSHGDDMDTECTALAAMALMKLGIWPQSTQQALMWITTHKFADGTHGSTQATILCLRALLAASVTSLGQQFESTVTISLNGRDVETFRLNKDNSDVMKQVNLTEHLKPGENKISFQQKPAGELPFLASGVYWLPASAGNMVAAKTPEPLEINLAYDRTTLPVNEQLHCTVTVKNNTGQAINMAIVDLGIPPGFDVDGSAFETLHDSGQIAKYETTGNQIILYLRELSGNTPFQFNYSLRARYPLRVQTPPSSAYEYYQPKNRSASKPVILQAYGN